MLHKKRKYYILLATALAIIITGIGGGVANSQERGRSGTHTENGVVVKFEDCETVEVRGNPDIERVQIFGEQLFSDIGWIGLNQAFGIDAPATVQPSTDNPAYIRRIRVLDEDVNELISAERSDGGENCRQAVTSE